MICDFQQLIILQKKLNARYRDEDYKMVEVEQRVWDGADSLRGSREFEGKQGV